MAGSAGRKPVGRGDVAGRGKRRTSRVARHDRPVLQINLLGGFEVAFAGTLVPSTSWRRRSVANLLKLLALAEGHRLARDAVLDRLWPDADPEAAANSLYQAIHGARRAMVPSGEFQGVTLRNGIVAFDESVDVRTDVGSFEAAARRAEAGDALALDEAVRLYRGDLLPDDDYDDWTSPDRDRLDKTYWRLLREVIRRHEGSGELDLAAARLRELIEHDRLDEEAHRRLMRLEARAGRTTEALRLFDELGVRLERELDVKPARATIALRDEIKAGDMSSAEWPTQLPSPPTSFIGRAEELSVAVRTLTTSRLLTLIGTAGAGKTRLALRLAHDLRGRFRDGAYFVPLESVAQPDLVASAMVDVLGVEPGAAPPEARLVEHLRGRETLCVLDNFEHLLSGATVVSRLLAASPGLKVVVTSRSPLRLAGERELSVPPFDLPEGIRLFVDRACFVDPTFALSDANRSAVTEIVARLDGLPLAIELAAARVRLLAVADIAGRLAARLPELIDAPRDWPERHRTLAAAIDWSYELLDAPNRLLFERFGVFAGGAGLTQIEAVYGPASETGRDVLAGLGALVEHSLLRRLPEVVVGQNMIGADPVSGPRFAMLPTIREYALGRLGERGEVETIHARHARAFVALAEELAPALTGDRARVSLERLAVDHDNIRGALSWAEENGQPEVALRLVAALWRFWQMHGDLVEAGERIDAVLAVPTLAHAPAVLHARALGAAGSVAYWRGEPERTRQFYEAAVQVARASGDPATLAESLYNAAFTLARSSGGVTLQMNPGSMAESLSIYRGLGDVHGIANSSWGLGLHYLSDRSLATAQAHFTDALAAYESFGDDTGATWALHGLGLVEYLLGDGNRAETYFDQALERMYRGANLPGVAFALLDFMTTAKMRGEEERSLKLAGAADALRARTGADFLVALAVQIGLQYPAAPEPGGPERALWDEGASMSVDEAVAFARVRNV